MMATSTSKMSAEDFEIKETISKGSFGTVYRIVRKADRQVFALKQILLRSMTRVDRQEAIDEARMLSRLSHPYIIKHYGSFTDSNDMLNIVMEYASGGTLYHLTRDAEKRRQKLSEDRVWKYIIQMLHGLDFIHGQRIVHRDIKSLNLFLDAHDNVKIGDFGISRTLGDDTDFLRTIVGTPFYLSPELCEDKPYNERTDVWALGVCMYELCMLKHPFTAQNEGALIRKILKGTYPPPSGFSPRLLDIIKLCLIFDHRRRPKCADLLRRPEVIAKARDLGISLRHTPASAPQPDKPVYDHPSAHSEVPCHRAPARDSLGQELSGARVPAADAAPRRDMAAAGVPADHPFAQQQAQALPAGHAAAHGAAGWPAEGPGAGAIGANGHAARPPLGNAAHDAMLMGNQEPGRHPFALHNHVQTAEVGIAQRMDRMALDPQAARAAQVQYRQAAAENVHACMHDNIRGIMHGQPCDRSVAAPHRVRPEELPPAGARPQSGSARAPFGQHAATHLQREGYKTQAQEQASAVWNASYERPQFARKRATDLMITGPNSRSPMPVSGRAPQAAGVYAYAGSEATTTTYLPATHH